MAKTSSSSKDQCCLPSFFCLSGEASCCCRPSPTRANEFFGSVSYLWSNSCRSGSQSFCRKTLAGFLIVGQEVALSQKPLKIADNRSLIQSNLDRAGRVSKPSSRIIQPSENGLLCQSRWRLGQVSMD